MSEQVQGAVESAMHTVTDNVDIETVIKERPLVSLGAAVIGGFVLSGLIDGDDNGHGSSWSESYSGDRGTVSSGGRFGGGSNLGSTLPGAIRESGFEETFNNAAAAMLGSFTEQLKDTMDRNMPGFADKMDSAKRQPGSVMDKTREVQP